MNPIHRVLARTAARQTPATGNRKERRATAAKIAKALRLDTKRGIITKRLTNEHT